MNIRFYGRGVGDGRQQQTAQAMVVTTPEDQAQADGRDPFLAHYIEENLADADVIAFEEIVNTRDFVRNVLKNRMRCQSYETSDRGHQHVMICYKNSYKLIPPPFDDNFIVEEATLGRRLRPVVHGILLDQDGTRMAYVAAVHLKANSADSAVRRQQVEVLASQMKELDPSLPTIIVGDFNTQNDDIERFNESFASVGLNLKNVENANPCTFRTPDFQAKFDHFWTNALVEAKGSIRTSRICATGNAAESDYDSVAEYNEKISDHCYIEASFRLK